jgi:hypothetical protein
LLQADYLGGSPTSGLRAGEVADLSTTITTVSQHTFFERVNGVEYNSVWVRAELRLMATPFTAPAPPDEDSFNDLSTPFTMQGEFAAFTDQAMTNQVFAVSVQGNGVAEFVWNQFQDNTYLASGAGGAVYRFVFPVEFPFAFASVGDVGLSGNSGTAEDGALYTGASGGDIWNTADAFGFTWRTVQADGEIVARITGQSNTNPFAKAGLMIRESAFDPSSAGVLIDVKPNHEVELMTRAASGAPTSYLGGTLVQIRLRVAEAHTNGRCRDRFRLNRRDDVDRRRFCPVHRAVGCFRICGDEPRQHEAQPGRVRRLERNRHPGLCRSTGPQRLDCCRDRTIALGSSRTCDRWQPRYAVQHG